MSKEVKAIGRICGYLNGFDRETRERMLRFVTDKHKHIIDKEDYVI